ncbi:sel1 repeat family protein [Asaia siamensis]
MVTRILRLLPSSPKRRRRRPEPAPELPEMIREIRDRAQQGHVAEQVRWGDILLKSIYMPPDPARARQWYEIAASAGYAPALNMLGRCLHFGWGGAVDHAAAAEAYEKAARLGDLWGNYNLAIMVMRGIGMKPDLPRALALFRGGAERGHAKSMNLLARFIEEGWRTPRDPALALDWYRRSAEGGDYRGQHNYATALCAMGREEEAFDWWDRAVVDATSDILLAMQRQIQPMKAERGDALMIQVAHRLQELGISNAE